MRRVVGPLVRQVCADSSPDVMGPVSLVFRKFLKATRLAEVIVETRFYGPATAIVNTRGDGVQGQTSGRQQAEQGADLHRRPRQRRGVIDRRLPEH